ncbi:tetratricopeptide repeat protein [Pseudorhodoferax sp.]|uniref:tetratricopeptide repeat protein n=1 Tax=Pseudorhodoferax sp. TaxID=1993553 RepID=UPI002DD6A6BF|nr:tetratricopeptide repeat protein [Pseudorhodoferax sp.]
MQRFPLPWPCAAGLLGLALAQQAAALAPQQIHAQASAAVAALDILDDNGQRVAERSATRIGPGRFVTVCEGLDAGTTLRLRAGGEPASAQLGARDRERNLCELQLPQDSGAPLALQTALPQAGQRVFAVSNALGLGVGISEGVVAGVRQDATGTLIQFTAPISPGSEGGALLDDEGRLLAILDYRRRDGQNVNFGAPVAWLAELAPRAAAAAEQLARLDAGQALAHQAQWPALAAHAAQWLAAQPGQPDALRFAAEAARAQQRPEDALNAWRALWRARPQDVQAGLDLAEALMQQQQLAEATTLARQLVAEHGGEARAHWLLARALHAGGELDAAEASYRRALAANPWLVAAYRGLAALAQARNDTGAAVAIFSRLSGLYPEEAWPRHLLIDALLRAKDFARAHAELQNLPPAYADSAEGWVLRGVVAARMGRPEAAVQAIRTGLARAPQDNAWMLAELGYVLAGLERYPEAIAALRDAVQRDPDTVRWRLLLGDALRLGGRTEEALGIAQQLVADQPGVAAHWTLLGHTLIQLDRHAEALPAIERALQLEPRDAGLWGALALVHQNLGQRAPAAEAVRRLRELDPARAELAYRSHVLPFEEVR